MSARIAIAAALIFAVEAPAASAPAFAGEQAEARAVVLAALDWELRIRSGIRPVCVSLEPRGAPLDGVRRSWASGRPPDRRFGTIDAWRGHGPPGRLADPAKARLQAALEAAIARPGFPALTLDDDLRWFPFTPIWPGCHMLVLSAPEIVGDFAFVEVDHPCFGLCSETWLVALERRDGRWTPVATITTAIS